jgi:hypothetical protein
MSLHDSASQVQSAGRGEDKVLVHMTPGEVSGLQSLAMAHGGSLTINPTTGLPEAGILSSLLPTLIGFGLAPLTGGLSAALITGAGYTAATGSLKKGIMAGLGAYGGAGLAGGLSSLGTTAVAPAGTAATAATPGLTSSVAANTSTLAGTTPLANVGNAAVSSVDDIFMQAAKAPVSTTAPGMTSAALKQTPVFDIAKYPNSFIPKPIPTASVTAGTDRIVQLGQPMNFPNASPTVANRIAAGKTQPFVSPIDKGSQ